MCYVSYQTDRFLAAQDREEAHAEWLGMVAQDDEFSRYLDDAMEESFNHLSQEDNESLENYGDFSLLSSEGKGAVLDRAQELAADDGFSRYDE